MQIWNHSPPDHPIRLWVTTRCTAEGETFGKFQLKSIRLSFTVIFPVCSFLALMICVERHLFEPEIISV